MTDGIKLVEIVIEEMAEVHPEDADLALVALDALAVPQDVLAVTADVPAHVPAVLDALVAPEDLQVLVVDVIVPEVNLALPVLWAQKTVLSALVVALLAPPM